MEHFEKSQFQLGVEKLLADEPTGSIVPGLVLSENALVGEVTYSPDTARVEMVVLADDNAPLSLSVKFASVSDLRPSELEVKSPMREGNEVSYCHLHWNYVPGDILNNRCIEIKRYTKDGGFLQSNGRNLIHFPIVRTTDNKYITTQIINSISPVTAPVVQYVNEALLTSQLPQMKMIIRDKGKISLQMDHAGENKIPLDYMYYRGNLLISIAGEEFALHELVGQDGNLASTVFLTDKNIDRSIDWLNHCEDN